MRSPKISLDKESLNDNNKSTDIGQNPSWIPAGPPRCHIVFNLLLNNNCYFIACTVGNILYLPPGYRQREVHISTDHATEHWATGLDQEYHMVNHWKWSGQLASAPLEVVTSVSNNGLWITHWTGYNYCLKIGCGALIQKIRDVNNNIE